MKKFNLFVGLATLSLAFILNAQHALNDYGVSDPSINQHPQVLAQTNSGGSGDGGGSGGWGIEIPWMCRHTSNHICVIDIEAMMLVRGDRIA